MTADDSTAVLAGGRYLLRAEIGRGGTAVVHRAEDRETGDEVAVKVFSAVSSPPGGRDRREIDILTGLRHPGLVAFRGAGTTDGHLFVVMDLVEGRSLAAALREDTLPVGTVAELGARLADALAHVHARGIVHRDVKPANILLDGHGRPRLADFGIAQLDGATRVTETGVVVGTAAYMAPEQVRGVHVGPPADVYALGLVLLEALTGLREYRGTPVEAAVARLHRSPAVPTGLPPRLTGLLRAMTATDPAERPTAAELARQLDAAAREAGGTGPATAAASGSGDRPARRLVPAAALGVLVAGVLGGWLLSQPDAAPTGVPTTAAPVTVDPAPADGSVVVEPAAADVLAGVPAAPVVRPEPVRQKPVQQVAVSPPDGDDEGDDAPAPVHPDPAPVEDHSGMAEKGHDDKGPGGGPDKGEPAKVDNDKDKSSKKG